MRAEVTRNTCDTFVDVRREATHEDFARVALDPLSVLVREAVWGTQARQALIRSLLVWEAVFHREQGRVS